MWSHELFCKYAIYIDHFFLFQMKYLFFSSKNYNLWSVVDLSTWFEPNVIQYLPKVEDSSSTSHIPWIAKTLMKIQIHAIIYMTFTWMIVMICSYYERNYYIWEEQKVLLKLEWNKKSSREDCFLIKRRRERERDLSTCILGQLVDHCISLSLKTEKLYTSKLSKRVQVLMSNVLQQPRNLWIIFNKHSFESIWTTIWCQVNTQSTY